MTSSTKQYVFAVDPWGFEVTVQADSYSDARWKAWCTLTPEQKDNCECLDWVDTLEV